jgi:hypothetical protein
MSAVAVAAMRVGSCSLHRSCRKEGDVRGEWLELECFNLLATVGWIGFDINTCTRACLVAVGALLQEMARDGSSGGPLQLDASVCAWM